MIRNSETSYTRYGSGLLTDSQTIRYDQLAENEILSQRFSFFTRSVIMKVIPLFLLVAGVFIALLVPAEYFNWWLRATAVLFTTMGAFGISRFYFRSNQLKEKTDQVKMQRDNTIEMDDTLSALKASEKVLDQKARLQEQLITSLTHDIKSPLKYLVITAKNVYEETASKTAPDMHSLQANVRLLYDAAYRMYYLTDNLLQYIKLHSKDEHISYNMVNVFNLVEDRLFIFRDMAFSQSIPVINNVPYDLSVKTNAHLLGIILYNLIDNAIKFTHEGEISISGEMKGNKLVLEVKDTGIGMDEDLVAWCNTPEDEIITREQKAELMLSRSKGLGLIIVKELTSLIKGRLHVQSSDAGTKMVIMLDI